MTPAHRGRAASGQSSCSLCNLAAVSTCCPFWFTEIGIYAVATTAGKTWDLTLGGAVHITFQTLRGDTRAERGECSPRSGPCHKTQFTPRRCGPFPVHEDKTSRRSTLNNTWAPVCSCKSNRSNIVDKSSPLIPCSGQSPCASSPHTCWRRPWHAWPWRSL